METVSASHLRYVLTAFPKKLVGNTLLLLKVTMLGWVGVSGNISEININVLLFKLRTISYSNKIIRILYFYVNQAA